MPEPEYPNPAEAVPDEAEQCNIARGVIYEASDILREAGVDDSVIASELLRYYVSLCIPGWSFDYPRVRANTAIGLENALREAEWMTPELVEQYREDHPGCADEEIPEGMRKQAAIVLAERAAKEKEKVDG